MRYFLDTEFNGFCGALISLALVPEAEGAAPFYAALDCTDPTDWVKTHVLPVIGIDTVSRAELSKGMTRYLSDDPDPLLVADWPEDISHAAMMLIAMPGHRQPIDRIRFELCSSFGQDSAAPSAVPHNAYHDAVALRSFVLGRETR